MNLQSSIPQGRAIRAAKPQAKAYDPAPIRRHIRHLQTVAGDLHFFSCKSKTRENHNGVHRIEIDTATREVRCSCEDFRYRHEKREPRIADTSHHCKHIAPCLNWLERHGQSEAARFCVHCPERNAEYELADENGHPIEGFICADCVTRAQMMNAEAFDEPELYAGYDEWLDELEAEDRAPDFEPAEYRGLMGQPCEAFCGGGA
jgi:hypothetical protein